MITHVCHLGSDVWLLWGGTRWTSGLEVSTMCGGATPYLGVDATRCWWYHLLARGRDAPTLWGSEAGNSPPSAATQSFCSSYNTRSSSATFISPILNLRNVLTYLRAAIQHEIRKPQAPKTTTRTHQTIGYEQIKANQGMPRHSNAKNS